MISEDSYCSDSYSEEKPEPCFPISPQANPSRLPLQISSRNTNNAIVKRRPIPGRSNIQKTTKLPEKKVIQVNTLKSPALNKKLVLSLNSDSSSYSEYDSESNIEDTPHLNVDSQIAESDKQESKQPVNPIQKQLQSQIQKRSIQKPSPRRRRPIKSRPVQAKPIKQDNNNLKQKDQNDDSSSESYVCEFYEDEEPVIYQDTDEEPEIQILNISIPKSAHTVNQLHPGNENIDTANISGALSQYSDCCKKENLKFVFSCRKSKLSNYTFRFYCDRQRLMTAYSSNIRKSVVFKVPEFFEQEDLVIGTMSISRNRRQFNLVCDGKEVLSASISTVKEPIFYEKFYTVNLKNPDSFKKDIVLTTLVPGAEANGKVSRKSSRNIVLINNNKEKLIMIKKVGKSHLKVEANPIINDDLKIFAFAVISWISQL